MKNAISRGSLHKERVTMLGTSYLRLPTFDEQFPPRLWRVHVEERRLL